MTDIHHPSRLPFRSRWLRLGVAVTAVLGFGLSAAGGAAAARAGGSSSFAKKGNAVCADADTSYGAALEAVGERYKPGDREYAAGEAAGAQEANRQEVKAMRKLDVPARHRRDFKAFLKLEQQAIKIDGQQSKAAIDGDKAKYQRLDEQRSKNRKGRDHFASRLGFDTCTGHGLSSRDVSQIKALITHSAMVNDPALCTDSFTQAFIHEQFGTTADCVQRQQQDPSDNPTSVDVSDVVGSKNLASATAVSHLPSGKVEKVSFGIYRQDGDWRLMGVQSMG